MNIKDYDLLLDELVVVDFTYEGEPRQTAGIFLKEETLEGRDSCENI